MCRHSCCFHAVFLLPLRGCLRPRFQVLILLLCFACVSAENCNIHRKGTLQRGVLSTQLGAGGMKDHHVLYCPEVSNQASYCPQNPFRMLCPADTANKGSTCVLETPKALFMKLVLEIVSITVSPFSSSYMRMPGTQRQEQGFSI